MVISAEPPPPPPPDPVAAAVEAVAAAATSNAHQTVAFSSFPSLKTWGNHCALRYAHVNRVDADAAAVEAVAAAATSNARQTWGSHRVLRYANVNRAGDATAMRSPGKLAVVEEKAALSHLREVEAGRRDAADADADNVAAAEEAAPALPLWKLRTRLATVEATPKPKVATPSANMLPPPPGGRRGALDRARFSLTLTSEEIEEDIYAVTGARPRHCPRRRPRPVQKQLDVTAETYRVPDD
ncbi:LOW QUALITY PROTEIN: hypothetical protein BDA96_02G414100, partial [Sorghum bicolor]